MVPACNPRLFLSLISFTYPGVLFLNVVVCYLVRSVAHFPLVSTTSSVNLVLFLSKQPAVLLFTQMKGTDVISDTGAAKP